MNEETPEDEGAAAEPVKVKQVAIAAGILTAALTAAVAFTVAGPLGVGVAAAGVAGTGYAAHRVRNPKTGRPGVLHSWLTRTRKTKTSGGVLTWPLTGNQTRRALSKSGRSGQTRAFKAGIGTGSRNGSKLLGPGGRRTGSRLPQTTRSRAARSAGGALPKHKAGRAVASPTRRALASSAGKPTGIRPPKTPTRTPTKASRSTLSPAMRRNPTSGRASSRSTRNGIPSSLTNSRSRHRPSGTTRRGTTPGRFGTKPRHSGRGRFNPWLGTRGGQSLGRRSTDSRRTRRAGRIGGQLGNLAPRTGLRGRMRHRLTPDRNRNTSPNRTRLRPRPYARRSTGQLLRTSLRVPKRQHGTFGSRRGWRPFALPTSHQAQRARRTLRLRSAVLLRRGVVELTKAPGRYSRWHWDRIWSRVPQKPLPLTHYTEKQTMKTPSGPKATVPKTPTPAAPKLADVIPITRNAKTRDISLMPIKQNGNVIYVSSPNDLIREAFQQMAAFHPTGAVDVEAWLIDLQSTLQDVGQSFGVLADQMRDSMPFAAPVTDSVREIGVAIGAVSGIAQSAHQTMRVAHEADFKRTEEPRPDEGMWNPENNR